MDELTGLRQFREGLATSSGGRARAMAELQAAISSNQRRPLLRRPLVLAAAAALVVIVVVATLAIVALRTVDGRSLFYSITGEVDGPSGKADPCHHERGSRWTCRISGKQINSFAVYHVELHGDCWIAKRAIRVGDADLPNIATGCVGLADRFRSRRP